MKERKDVASNSYAGGGEGRGKGGREGKGREPAGRRTLSPG